MMRTVFTAASLAALTAMASAANVDSFGALNAGVVIGSGIPNANFTINTNDNGVQTGIKAFERFVGDITRSGNTYFAEPGNSPTSGAAGAPADPGTATWNYLFSVDLGTLTFNDVFVNVAIDFNPAYGNSNVFEFELVSALGLTTQSLYQDSQNLGFGFWQTIGDPDIFAFDPFAPGEYSMTVDVLLRSTGESLSNVAMNVVVVVVPLPTGGAAGLAGLVLLGMRRRRSHI